MREFLQDVKALGGAPFFLIVIVFAFFTYTELAYVLLWGFVGTLLLTAAIRAVYFRPRPDRTKYRTWWERLDASSFPSLHAMRAFFLATVFSMSFPSVILGVLLFACAGAVAWMRVWKKRHYVSDVVVGCVLGILFGFALL